VSHDSPGSGAAITVRPAVAADVPLLKSLIDRMAAFERLPVTVTREALLADGFGPQPLFRALIAQAGGATAGYALYHSCYSSFSGKAIFLEDLYVEPEARRKRVAQALLARVAATAIDEGCFGLVFNTLLWNTTALAFFQHAGAQRLEDWGVLTLTGEALQAASVEGWTAPGRPESTI